MEREMEKGKNINDDKMKYEGEFLKGKKKSMEKSILKILIKI